MIKVFSEVYFLSIGGTIPALIITITVINLTLFINDSKMDAEVKFIADIGPLLTIDALLEADISEDLISSFLIDTSHLKSIRETWNIDCRFGLIISINIASIDLIAF